MDGYTLSISRCSGGDGVEESFKAKIKRREAALDAVSVETCGCHIECLRAELLNVWHGLTDIADIVKSSEGHPGGCPFSLAFWEPPCGRREGAGALRERGLGAAFPPFQQPAGRARNPPAIESAEKPSTWRKRGTDLPGFPTFRQAPGQSRNPPPIGMLKTPSSRETIGRRRGKAGHAAAAR